MALDLIERKAATGAAYTFLGQGKVFCIFKEIADSLRDVGFFGAAGLTDELIEVGI
uniref:hypothetical protein n=1 Tax=Granulicella tundricola TaxID=940615 RepID=UPI00030F1DB3|nr:hypothetical protein [Granulicella tundricola]